MTAKSDFLRWEEIDIDSVLGEYTDDEACLPDLDHLSDKTTFDNCSTYKR